MGISAPGVGIHGTPDRGVDRVLGLARLHPHADPAGRVAVRAGRDRDARLHRRGLTMAGRLKLVGADRRRRPSWRRCSALLVWKVVTRRAQRGAGSAGGGQDRRRRRVSSSRGSTRTASSRSRRCAARRSSSTSGRPGASRARRRRRCSRQAWQRYRDDGLVVVGIDYDDFKGDARPVRQALRDRRTRSSTIARRRPSNDYGVIGVPRRSSSTGRAGSSASASPARSTRRELDGQHRAGARRREALVVVALPRSRSPRPACGERAATDARRARGRDRVPDLRHDARPVELGRSPGA